jgi:hypothetical protein
MDPYLEQYWRDVHASLVIYARDHLQAHLPPDLRARVEERVLVESPELPERSVYPDVRVVERGRGKAGVVAADSSVAVAEPVVIWGPDEPMTETYIEIIDVGSGKRVVTVIEVLSMANKLAGPGQDLYVEKQRELKAGRVNLVEIDLLRAGKRVFALEPQQIPLSHRTTYQVCIWRATRPGAHEVYRMPLRERLPAIRVPLRATDADVPLDLQALVDQCYRNGGYDEDIDYRAEPDPPLDPDDARWADELLRSQGRR